MSAEALQQLMSTMQTQNKEQLQELLRQQLEVINTIVQGTARKGMTDSRGIGRPTTFKGEEGRYKEWKAKLLAYVKVNHPESQNWVDWATTETSTITPTKIREK